jgi:hypothetical protein
MFGYKAGTVLRWINPDNNDLVWKIISLDEDYLGKFYNIKVVRTQIRFFKITDICKIYFNSEISKSSKPYMTLKEKVEKCINLK